MIKKILKTKKFYIFSAILLSLIGLAVYFISGALKTTDNLNYKAYVGHYETDKNPITSFTYKEAKKDIELNKFYTGNVNDDTFTPKNPTSVTGFTFDDTKKDDIGISTMAELVAFSYLCNPDKNPTYYKSYLTYHYVLTNNISNDSAALYFIPVGTEQNFPFKGTFNGNNYDITGLSFITITDINGDTFTTSYPKTKNAINYFAMFSRNSGTIGNFGLINTNISFNYTSTSNKFDKVAMLCGENSGKGSIEKVYVRDLRSASSNKSGIMAFGGYIISGLVFNNSGTLKNSYVAYNSVVNGAVFDCHDFNEILYTNTGTVENLYVYNQSVRSIEGEADNATVYPVGGEGNPQIGIEKKITYTNGQTKKRKLYATYCYTYQKQSQDEKEVETKYLNYYMNSKDDQTWFTATTDDFNTIDAAYNMSTLMPTPILRGIKYNTNDENDKYFIIESERDYAFMYEMFNSSSYFASTDFTYQIEANINLNELAPIRYTYSGGIGASIRGKVGEYSGVNTEVKTLPTIYCPEFVETYTKVEGFNAFGLFPYVKKGTIKDLNVVAVASQEGTKEISLTVGNQSIAAFGVICGYLDSGKIDNVNVYENINLIGNSKAFIGGAVGVLTGLAEASNISNNGQLNVNITAVKEDPIDYMKGISVGGVVGYIHNSMANINNSLNNAKIDVKGISSVDYTVGGILGAGYTNKIENVENTGNITFDNKYKTLYIAGVIGRHLGINEQSDGLTNYGNITITNNSNDTYVCGVVNATPITDSADNYLLSNNYKYNGEYYYIATMLTNGATITVNNNNTYQAKTHLTDVINVKTSECITKLSSVHNLSYKENYNGEKTKIADNTIVMNAYRNYAPVINYEYNNSKYDYLDLSTAYNLKNVNYTMSGAINAIGDSKLNLNYTNVVNGSNVNLINVRNEGNITFTINNAFTANLFASGIIKSISAKNIATSVVNSGNITLKHSAMITGNINIAGICYENKNTSLQSSIDLYNPNKGKFDSNATGSLNNIINAGNIEVTNDAYATGISYIPTAIVSNNNNQLLGFRYNLTYNDAYIKGNINVSGITNLNYSIITNAFNVGDMFTANVCKDNGFKMNTAGLVDLNIGEFAYILNSANNGDIKSINLYNSSIKTDLTSSGIVARNDLTEELNDYNGNTGNPQNSKQVIAFTINYGSIYAYNFNENIEGSSEKPYCEAAGIVGMGLLNVVNVLNYGNIFGSETVSGIFGVVYFERFANEIDENNKVKLANTINYGNTYILYKGYNSGDRAAEAKARGTYDHNIIDYALFKSFDLNYETFKYSGNKYDCGAIWKGEDISGANPITSQISGTQYRIDYAYHSVAREVNNKAINGSIFSIINFNNDSNAQYITIRYLINFEENAPIVGFEPATPSNTQVERTTIYSAYTHLDTRNNGSGQLVRDTYMAYDHSKNGTTGNNYVVYSPLNSDTNKYVRALISDSGISITDSSQVETDDIKYNGVFSKNFKFYQAIIKSYSLDEINDNPTDAFLSDFFQFVEYSYINDALVEKIGWKQLAYASAANAFARSAERVDGLLNRLTINEENYSSFTDYALDHTSIWTKWSTKEILTNVVNSLIENNDISNLTLMMEYIFSSESKSNVLIDKELRENLYGIVSKKVGINVLNQVFSDLLTYENGYSKILADSILDNNSDVYDFIVKYIKSLDFETIENILTDYINILSDDKTNYFDYSTNLTNRYKILDSMFSKITNNLFYKTLCEVLDISSTISVDDKLKMYQGYDTLQNDSKFELYLRIIENNNYENIGSYLSSKDEDSSIEGEIGYYARIVETGYNTTNINNTFSQIGSEIIDNNDETIINERVDIWNHIKNTTTFRDYIKSRMTQDVYYFLATEHRNTYQSNTAPADAGAKDGDLSYYYTPIVTPSTYFYGPYSYASEDGSSLTYPTENTKKTVYYAQGNKYRDLTLADDQVLAPVAGAMHNVSTSVFIGDNLSYFNSYYKLNNTGAYNNYRLYTTSDPGDYNLGTNYINGVGSASLFLYEFGYTGANNQFTSGSIVDGDYYKNNGIKTDFGGSKFKTTNAYLVTTINGTETTINISDGAISGHWRTGAGDEDGYFEIIDANGNKFNISDDFYIYDDELSSMQAETSINNDYYEIQLNNKEDNKTKPRIWYKNTGDDAWGDLLVRYGRVYYYALVNQDYHPTRRTGIYKYKSDFSAYNNYGVTWFTNKKDDTAVFTSQTIDYTVEQLLELDGIYTNYIGNPLSKDERSIINTIFNKYLCNDSSNLNKVIRKALLETLSFDKLQNHLALKWNMGVLTATRGTLTDTYYVKYNQSATNFYSNYNTVEGTISYRYYYNNEWLETNAIIRVYGLKFDSNGNCTAANVFVRCRSDGNQDLNNSGVTNVTVTRNGKNLTVAFKHRTRDVSVPIALTTGMVVDRNSIPNNLSMEINGSSYYIKDGNTILTTINGNQTNATYLNNTNYYYKNLEYNNTSGISFDYVLKSAINNKFIDNFIVSNIYSDLKIDNKIPFAYLMNTGSQTVEDYLIGLVTTNIDYKTMLIMNSISNETTYYLLINELLKLRVLSLEEIEEELDVTLSGVTEVNAVNPKLNGTDTSDLLTNTIAYSNVPYKSNNEYGFTTSSLVFGGYSDTDVIIIAKGKNDQASMIVTLNCSGGDKVITSDVKLVTSDNNPTTYNGIVSNASTYLYVIPQTSLNDMVEVTAHSLDTEYFTYDSNTKTYNSVGVMFPSGIDYYRNDGTAESPSWKKTANIGDTHWFDGHTQFYTHVAGAVYNPVNDSSVTYYKKSNSVAPTITLTMTNSNVIIYDILKSRRTYKQEVNLTYDYFVQNTNDSTSVNLDSLSTMQTKVEASDDYADAISTYTSDYIKNQMNSLGYATIDGSYSYNYYISSVDSQFVIRNSNGTKADYNLIETLLIDKSIDSNPSGKIMDYVFTSVGTLTESEFNSMRNILYYRNGNTGGNTYSYEYRSANNNNFKGNDNNYYSKVDYAVTVTNGTKDKVNGVMTITRGTYSSTTEYYTLSFSKDGVIAQYTGKFNNEALLNTSSDYVNSISINGNVETYTLSKENNIGINLAGLYNLQRGFLSKRNNNDGYLSKENRINAGAFVMGESGIAVLNPADPGRDTIKNNIKNWVDSSNFESYSKKLNSSTTVQLDPIFSNNTNDYSNSTQYSRLIDLNSFDDLKVNLFDSTNPSSSNLGNNVQLYRTFANTNYNKTNSGIFVPYIDTASSNNGNVYIVNVLYKIKYTITFEMAYEQASDELIDFSMSNDSINNFLSSEYYRSGSSVDNDNHITDLSKVLTNLLPLKTGHYITSTDISNLKTQYNENNSNLETVNSLFLEYLSNNSKTIEQKEYSISEFYKIFVCDSNESFEEFLHKLYINNPDNLKNIYSSLLNSMMSNNAGYNYIADFIDKYHSIPLKNTDRFITAAYLASDYENEYQQSLATGDNSLLYLSELRKMLEGLNITFNDYNIQYINDDSDNPFDADKFDALKGYIDDKTKNDIYGIYALASSKGIKNGDFIPDNLNLSSMEAYYEQNDTYGYILLDEESANWRINGEKDAKAPYNTRYEGNNSTAYSDSINYAFLIDMKQLKKSIATTLFELDLDVEVSSQYTSKYTMYSSEDLIEEYKLTDGSIKKAVIYYVPTNFLEQIKTPNKTLTVSDIVISTTAKAYKNDTNNEVEKNNTNYNSNTLVKCNTLFASDYYQNSKFNDSYVLQNAIRIVAEETSVFRYYDIVLMPVDFSFSAKYQTITNTTNYVGTPTDKSATVAAIKGVVSIKLQSPVYVQTSDSTMQAGSVYYEKVGNDYIEVDEFENDHTYYSVYTRATSKQFEAGKTYYTFDTETNKYTTANVTVDGNIIGDYYLAGKAFKLPMGYDLSKYISISLPGGNSIKDAFTFNDIQGNYIVKDDGSADITLDISSTLAKGTYDLSIDLFGCVEKLTLIKNPNNDTSFSMKYDGIPLDFTNNNGEVTSMILWGTPFRYLDLYDLTYSDSYELAPNAKMKVTIDTDVDDVAYDNFQYSVCTYNITIKVTAEDGTTVKTYKHILKEYDPFTVGEAYATVYKEGEQILNPALNTTSGSATDSNYVAANITTLTYPRNEGEPDYRIKYDMSKIYYNGSSSALNDNDIHSYNEYKYDTSGYVLVDAANMTALKPVELLYAGMTVQLNEKIDTGSYTFAFVYKTYTLVNAYYELSYEDVDVIEDTFITDGTYTDSADGYLYVRSNDEPYTYTKVTDGTYSSTASYCKLVYKVTTDLKPQDGKTYYTKSDDTYSVADTSIIDSFDKMGVARTLEFPKVTVIKNPAVDAVIESATFINNYEALGSLATLINPQKSIVPSIDAYNRNSGEPLYNDLIAGSGQKMTVDATDRSIKYVLDAGSSTDSSTTNYETKTDDYYVVGTTSNANLKNYAPSVALRSEYAKFFQYLSPKKVTNYDGIFNGGTDEKSTKQDYVILNDHKDEYIYLYVLFNDDSVFLVKTNLKDMSYSEIYLTDSKTGLGKKIADIDTNLGLKGRGLYNIAFDYNGVHYKASTLNGDTSTRNNALYMDYTKATKNERFWYVSYVVFSEDFFLNGLGNNVPNVEDIATNNIWSHRAKFYNIAVIDISNNIRFTIEVDAPDGFNQLLQSLYVTLSYNKYVSSVLTDSKQLSLYAEYQDKLYDSDNAQSKVNYVSNGTYYYDDLTTESRILVGWSGNRMDTYIPEYALQLMPTAYYKFYINLPSGYEATYTVTKGKENTYKKNPNSDEAGSYLPPSSLVTQDIKITITIKAKDVDEATSTWGINTSDVIVTEITPDSSVNPTE